MNVEVRKIETTYAETGVGQADRIEATYELGFATPNGGWVKFASVPAQVVAAADQAAAATKPPEPPAEPEPPGEPEPDAGQGAEAPPEPATVAPAEASG